MEIKQARKVIWNAFQEDPDFKRTYVDNAACILMDELGIEKKELRDSIALQIVDRFFKDCEDEKSGEFPHIIWSRSRRLEFVDNNSDLIVLVMAGNVKQFDSHLEELIEKYKHSARRISYVHGENQLQMLMAGQKRISFEKVGQYYQSKIRLDYWEAIKDQCRACGRLEEL